MYSCSTSCGASQDGHKAFASELVLVSRAVTDLGICCTWQQALLVKAHAPDGEHLQVGFVYLQAERALSNSPDRVTARLVPRLTAVIDTK